MAVDVEEIEGNHTSDARVDAQPVRGHYVSPLSLTHSPSVLSDSYINVPQ